MSDQTAPPPAQQSVNATGSCHCGRIRYRVNIPASGGTAAAPTATRCNCTFCQKTGFTGMSLSSSADIQLVTPESWDQVPQYMADPKTPFRHYYCNNCGVHVYSVGYYEIPASMAEPQESSTAAGGGDE